MSGWEQELEAHFPGFLMPSACRSALDPQVASRVLERLAGRPDLLAVLQAASLVTSRAETLQRFANELLPDLVRVLPARSETLLRTWEGGFQGRLDVKRTMSERLAGRPTRFVTRARRRTCDLPENVLIREVCERLVSAVDRLQSRGVALQHGWGGPALQAAARLRFLLQSTNLREIPARPCGGRQIEAALRARHPAYNAAVELHSALGAADSRDPARVARLVAEGALLPADAPRRFELAVLVRLIRGLDRCLGDAWRRDFGLVLPRRQDVVSFCRSDGLSLRVIYDRPRLDGAERDAGVRHYLGRAGRARPDVTIVVERGGAIQRAVVVEVKLTARADYLTRGYEEALVYRWEYRRYLTGWPKAILVGSEGITGPVRTGDDVIAVGWKDWAPQIVLDGILSDL